MTTKLDRSDVSGVLVTCTECPYWFAFAWTAAAAHDSACRHEELVHPGLNEASTRRAKFRSYAARRAGGFVQSQ